MRFQTTDRSRAAAQRAGIGRPLVLLPLAISTALFVWAPLWDFCGSSSTNGGAAVRHSPDGPPIVQPTAHGGVHRYSIPGEFDKVPPASGTGKRAGTLHIYLKALRWPMEDGSHHLRMKGFVAFEFNAQPATWRPHVSSIFKNVPEVASKLHLLLHSSQGWQREVQVVHTNGECERVEGGPGFDMQACLEREARKTNLYYHLSEFSIDLGPAAAVDFFLMVQGWPRRVSIKRQLQAALAGPPAEAGTGAVAGAQPPAVYRALPCLFNVRASVAARILAWQDDYHRPLGLAGTVMYVLPKDEVELAAQPRIRELVAAGRLTLVLWDDFAPFKIVENHALLSFWGRNVRVLVADVDELIVPAVPGDTLPSMLAPGGCMAAPGMRQECMLLFRRDVFPIRQQADSEPAPDEPSWWRNVTGPNPLPKYRYAGPPLVLPKVMAHPASVATVFVHYTSICTGTTTVVDGSASGKLESACGTRQLCSRVGEECAFLAHIPNMLVARRTRFHPGPDANSTSEMRLPWLALDAGP